MGRWDTDFFLFCPWFQQTFVLHEAHLYRKPSFLTRICWWVVKNGSAWARDHSEARGQWFGHPLSAKCMSWAVFSRSLLQLFSVLSPAWFRSQHHQVAQQCSGLCQWHQGCHALPGKVVRGSKGARLTVWPVQYSCMGHVWVQKGGSSFVLSGDRKLT